MGILELVLLAVGLAMDAFAVSICKGLSVPKMQLKHALICGAWFGGFQFLMPVVGYLLGYGFQGFIQSIDHWIAFILLALIGSNMIKEALSNEEEEVDASFAPKAMAVLAVATSIDALAVGVTFAFLQVQIIPAALTIGVITFVISSAGVKVGNVFGARYKNKAELVGGIVLICIALKILLEHLELLPF